MEDPKKHGHTNGLRKAGLGIWLVQSGRGMRPGWTAGRNERKPTSCVDARQQLPERGSEGRDLAGGRRKNSNNTTEDFHAPSQGTPGTFQASQAIVQTTHAAPSSMSTREQTHAPAFEGHGWRYNPKLKNPPGRIKMTKFN